MVTIRELLDRWAPGRCHDAGLSWREAIASRYRPEILATLSRGCTVVLVELADDIGLDTTRMRIVDHHGARAGREPTSIEQVFAILGLGGEHWTRWHALVSANDSGHVEGMMALGATREEMLRIREADRAAQGVMPDEERAAEEALRHLERPHEDLAVVVLPHDRTATVTDRLHAALGGSGYRTLLIESPREVNVFAPGWVIERLLEWKAGGWWGGNLPHQGYWGCARPIDGLREMLTVTVSQHSRMESP